MRRNIDNVEIKEPPIQELNKNRSCLKRSCFTGCIGLLIIIVLFWVVLRYAATPRAKQLKEVPEIVPESIHIYDEDSIAKISLVSSKQQNKAIELVAVIPKLLIAPFYLSAEEYLPDDIRSAFDGVEEKSGWEKFKHLVRNPLFEQGDIVTIEWEELAAEPSFVMSFYEKELEKEDYSVRAPKTELYDLEELTFSKDNIKGTLSITDNPDERGTDAATLTIIIGSDT